MSKLNPFANKAGLETLLAHGTGLLRDFTEPSVFGAHSAVCFGPIGSGKTSLLLALAEIFRRKGWYVILRGREILEVPRLPGWKDKTEFFVPEGYNLRTKIQGFGSKKYRKLSAIEYKSVSELVKFFHRNKISVVYAPEEVKIPPWLELYEGVDIIPAETLFWYEFYDQAIKKLGGKKTAIFIDEAHELWPSSSRGAYWHIIEKTKNKIADFRKSRIVLVVATHTRSDLDWRIISKTDYRFYLPGARPLSGSLVKPKMAILLKKGYAFIEHSKFGLIKFKLLPDNGEIWVTTLKKRS